MASECCKFWISINVGRDFGVVKLKCRSEEATLLTVLLSDPIPKVLTY